MKLKEKENRIERHRDSGREKKDMKRWRNEKKQKYRKGKIIKQNNKEEFEHLWNQSNNNTYNNANFAANKIINNNSWNFDYFSYACNEW